MHSITLALRFTLFLPFKNLFPSPSPHTTLNIHSLHFSLSTHVLYINHLLINCLHMNTPSIFMLRKYQPVDQGIEPDPIPTHRTGTHHHSPRTVATTIIIRFVQKKTKHVYCNTQPHSVHCGSLYRHTTRIPQTWKLWSFTFVTTDQKFQSLPQSQEAILPVSLTFFSTCARYLHICKSFNAKHSQSAISHHFSFSFSQLFYIIL